MLWPCSSYIPQDGISSLLGVGKSSRAPLYRISQDLALRGGGLGPGWELLVSDPDEKGYLGRPASPPGKGEQQASSSGEEEQRASSSGEEELMAEATMRGANLLI